LEGPKGKETEWKGFDPIGGFWRRDVLGGRKDIIGFGGEVFGFKHGGRIKREMGWLVYWTILWVEELPIRGGRVVKRFMSNWCQWEGKKDYWAGRWEFFFGGRRKETQEASFQRSGRRRVVGGREKNGGGKRQQFYAWGV